MQMLKQPITQGKLDELLASAKAIHDQNPRANFPMNLDYEELVQMLTSMTVVVCPHCCVLTQPDLPVLHCKQHGHDSDPCPMDTEPVQ